MTTPTSIEVTGSDIETAIEKGVAQLGVPRDAVMVEILEEPQRRILGLGGRDARVRLTVIRAPQTPNPSDLPPARSAFAPSAPTRSSGMPLSLPDTYDEDEPQPPQLNQPTRDPRGSRTGTGSSGGSRGSSRGDDRRPGQANDSRAESRGGGYNRSPDRPTTPRPYADLDEEFPEMAHVPSSTTPTELAEDATVSAEVLRELLTRMQIRATVDPRQSETTPDEPQHWILEITGSDLGLLIGRRGETLAALQYITRLIASRKLGRRANIVIDVEGYKARRETMLRRLAKRMAEQAIQRGRTVTLEPMPPHERRIIHLTLRQIPGVTTESTGEGDHRKVTIVPKRNPRD